MATDTKKFKGLVLDRGKLPEYLQIATSEFLTSFTMSEFYVINEKGGQYRVEIIGADKPIYIDFYFKSDDTTTIYPFTGPNQELGVKIAEKVLESLDFNQDDAHISHSIQPIDKDDFEIIVEYLGELEEKDDCKQIRNVRNDANRSTLYQYRSKYGDKITLTYYDNKRFRIQGKPYYLYQEISSLMSGFVSFEEMVKQHSVFFKTDISPAETRDEMKQMLPNAYNALDETLRAILSPSIALQHVPIELDDYTCFAFPALRGLEGFIKIIFAKFGIRIPGKTIVGSCYTEDPSGGGVHTVSPGNKTTIGDATAISHLDKMYNYYKNNRHGLFHTDQIIAGTRLLTTKIEAQQIINDVIKLIEDAHNDIIGN